MPTSRSALAAFCLVVASAASAQHAGHPPRPDPAPYATLRDREIKALPADQIADLRAGRGMSLALPAELNGYPGPLHVLELEQQLALSPAQRQAAADALAAMRAETTALGEALIAAELELDRLFSEDRASEAAIGAAAAKAAAAQGELRAAHLRRHLAMKVLLSPVQIANYQHARGYRDR